MKSLIPMNKQFVLNRCDLVIVTALEYAKIHDAKVETEYNARVNWWRKYTFRKPLTLEESTDKLKAKANKQWFHWISELNYPCLTHCELAREIKLALLCTEGDTVYINPGDWADL